MSNHHLSNISSRFNSRSGSNYVSRTFTVMGKVVGSGNSVDTSLNSEPPVTNLDDSANVNSNNVQLKLTFLRVLGKGTFGCIEQAQLNDKPELVAVKRVYQDPRFKNRELDILLGLSDHPNLVQLLYYYYTSSKPSKNSSNANSSQSNQVANDAPGSSNSELYLHLVMECFPESLADLIVRYCRRSQKIPIFDIKLYTYQLMRALGYIHLQSICHRDIKSSNLLVNEATGQIKLCDFGSAKKIIPDQPNVSYISSRYYRAPELIFGAEQYDCSIDVWSAGCVVAELLIRKCLFMGSDSVEQLAEIIKVLGTPSQADVRAMNPRYSSYSFPNVPRCPLKLYMPMETPSELINLLSRMLVYNPAQRIKPLASLAEAAFNVLREKRTANLSGLVEETNPNPTPIATVTESSSTAAPTGTASSSARRPTMAVHSQRQRVPPTLFQFLPKELDAESLLQGFHESLPQENGSEIPKEIAKSDEI